MKIAALTGMALLAVTSLHGQTVAVYVADDVGIRSCQLYVAKHRAADIFAAAAVRIAWQTGQPHDLEGGRPIVVHIISNRPKCEHPGALAFALVYEGTHITILYERVRAAMPETPEVELAYVLVHEITHIIENVCRHSDTGVMKAKWSLGDHYEMMSGQLALSPEDVRLIHIGFQNRGLISQ